MRTIRNFVVLFILFLFLGGTRPLLAADSYFTVTGCEDPKQTCATSGDGVNTVVQLSGIEAVFANFAADLGPDNFLLKLFGSLKPKSDIYRIGSDKLTAFGNQIQNASDSELNPAALQDIGKHDETSKSASMTSRECVYEGNNLVADIVSTTTIVTADVPWIRPAAEGSRRLSSFTTGYVQESQDFTLPNITIKQDEAIPCNPLLNDVPGETKIQNETASQFSNIYGSGGVEKFISGIISTIFGLFADDDAPKPDVSAKIIGTGQNPYTGHTAALSAGCATDSDLSDLSYATDEQKKKLCAAGGFVNSMYRPDGIDPTYTSQLDAKDDKQEWEQNITDDPVRAPLSSAFAARVEAAGDYMNCTLLPAGYQSTALPGGECNTRWAKATATTGSGDVCKTANDYHIPCCMLMGIMKQETDFGSYQSTSACPAHPEFQCCYEGFGCGPANILCSQYSDFAGTDKPDLCSMDGSAVLLARALRLKLCMAAGECTSHNWTKWETAAMKPQYDIPSDIYDIESYTATGYFYGIPNGCFPDACTQYIKGPGMSYCDSVKHYCTTSSAPDYADGQPLPNKTSPEFCEKCKARYLELGLTPPTCP